LFLLRLHAVSVVNGNEDVPDRAVPDYRRGQAIKYFVIRSLVFRLLLKLIKDAQRIQHSHINNYRPVANRLEQ
jgi:hypothetical protein